MDSGGEGEGGVDWEIMIDIYTSICKLDSQGEFAVWPRELKPGFLNNLEGWDEGGCGQEFQKGGDIGIPKADSCRCLAETNTIL